MDYSILLLWLVCVKLSAFTLPSYVATSIPATALHQVSSSLIGDPSYEWIFEGRAMLRPCLQHIDKFNNATSRHYFYPISLFGWTLGGRVTLQYDVSPAENKLGYNEHVVLGCLGVCEHGIGQVGSALYVNETSAVDLCESVWDLGAQLARIELREEGTSVDIQENQDDRSFLVNGWSSLRSESAIDRNVQLNLFWTPTITGIWLKLLPWWPFRTTGGLPVHRLRVSGNAKVQLAGLLQSEKINQVDQATIFPLGVDIILKNLRIEISPRIL